METRTQFFVTELVAEMDSMPTLAAQVVSLLLRLRYLRLCMGIQS